MKQTLTELAEIMRAVDDGAEWECDIPEMGWHKNANQGKLALLQLASYGWAIRLKPAEPDAEGWIPWQGGECPVQTGVLVDVKYRNGEAKHKLPANQDAAEAWDASPCFWSNENLPGDIIAYRIHKEPDPHPNRKEVEEGIKQGRRWQNKPKGLTGKWITADVEVLPQWLPDYEYRLEPEPEYIPLGPGDVPPGSSIKHAEIEALVVRVGVGGVWIVGRTGTPDEIEFEELKDEWLINRSLPLTGKWDPTAWEPCRKLKGGDNE